MCGSEETNFIVSQAIYAYGSSFNVVQAPSLKDIVRAVNEAPMVTRDWTRKGMHYCCMEREVYYGDTTGTTSFQLE